MNGDNKFSIKYLMWFLDMVVAAISFYAATFIRFQNFRDMYSKNLHFLVCVVIIFVASVYSFGVDVLIFVWSSNKGFSSA